MKNTEIGKFFVVALFAALVASLLSIWAVGFFTAEKTQEELIADYYAAETAVLVSPHHLRKDMTKGYNDFILVDLRSQEEYEREHVIAAINIPAYASPEKSAYGDVERIVNAFEELGDEKEIIVYCYSMPCMTGRKIGNMLAEHDIYVRELGVGWNEWRYFWTLWNHEHEWEEVRVEDYVISGAEPGVFEGAELAPTACTAGGEFDC